ncbi:MAG TPA: diaminopimelate decarboxylase [Stellaceae bacterium]|nr:diaminopimelate decarboxylase [Stellaceae bacterium]
MNNGLPGTPEFAYRDGELQVEDVRLGAVAEAVGTPVYGYSAAHIERQYRRFAAAFAGTGAGIFYSVKANSNVAVVATLARLGAGADVVSEGEFRRALAAGVPGERVVFSGIGKTAAELRFALTHGVRQINVESFPELALVADVATGLGRRASVSIRVNPDVDAQTHAKITTGLAENKFGIDVSHVHEAFVRMRDLPALEPVGIAVHIGSQLTSLAPFEQAFARVVALIAELRSAGFAVERLDLGGGIGIRYRDETPPAIEDYAALVRRLVGPLNVHLAFEPGRLIVGNAGALVARVLYIKEGVTRRFIVLDAAMNDLMRPALYEAWHEIVPLVAPRSGAPLAPADVVGPVCETGDSFASARDLPPLAAGDYVALLSAGAYGASMGSSYNTRLPAAEVLVRGSTFEVIRRRPSYDEVLAQDRMPSWLAER